MDARPRDAERPIAVFKGREWVGCVADPCFLFTIALTGIAIAAAFARIFPWPSALAGAPGLEGLVLLFGLAGFATLVVIQRWALARLGQAELFVDRIVVKQRRQFIAVRLLELDAFDDRSTGFVRLIVAGEGWARARREVTVPTPHEASRALLVQALAGAGVPRADGQPLESRARAALGPALLSVTNTPIAVGLALAFSLVILVVVLAMKARLGPLDWAVMLSLLVGLPVLAAVWANPRTGTVRFHEDRIVGDPFAQRSSDAWHLSLAWDDVVGWRPSSRDYVRLVLRPGLLRSQHGEPSVPTPTPELRAAVEALLAARGVPRL